MAFDPEDPAMVSEMADEFHAKSGRTPCMYGTVLAVDGIHIKIIRPRETDTLDSDRHYVDRKGCHAWNIQAMVDGHKRFRLWDMSNPGQASDSMAYLNSAMRLVCDKLPEGYWVVGDAAHALSQKMLPPYRGNKAAWANSARQAGRNDPAKEAERKSNFNFFQSQQRITVECAFGCVAGWLAL